MLTGAKIIRNNDIINDFDGTLGKMVGEGTVGQNQNFCAMNI